MALRKSDDKPVECRIFIDLKKGTIDFEHLLERQGRLWYAWNIVYPSAKCIAQVLSVSLSLFFAFLPLLFVLLYSIGEYSKTEATVGVIVVVSSYFLLTWVFPSVCFIASFIPGFNSNVMPKLGAASHKLSTGSTEILVTEIKDGVFEIPLFENAYLHYKCFGDFNECIERIEIVEHPIHYMQLKKHWRCGHWRAIFYFNKQPSNGCMKVVFI